MSNFNEVYTYSGGVVLALVAVAFIASVVLQRH